MMTDLHDCAVIFDLDGTLIDTASDLGHATNHALASFDLPMVPLSEVRHLVGGGARVMLRRGFEYARGTKASEDEIERALAVFLEYYVENIAVSSRPFDGVMELIERLRAKSVAVGICTNKREMPARKLIEALGLNNHFGAIVGGDTCGVAKPDPAPVRKCLEDLGRSRAVFVGDSDTDIRAAKATGLPCVIGTFGYGPLELIDEVELVIDRYEGSEPAILDLLHVA